MLINCPHCFFGLKYLFSGDSEGLYYGEYLQQEQDDCVDVLKWIGEQAWSNKAVRDLIHNSKKHSRKSRYFWYNFPAVIIKRPVIIVESPDLRLRTSHASAYTFFSTTNRMTESVPKEYNNH